MVEVGLIKELNDFVSVFLFEGDRLGTEFKDFEFRKEEFEGKLEQSILLSSKTKARKLLLVGLGKRDEFELDNLRKAAGVVVRTAKSLKRKDVTINYPQTDRDEMEVIQALTEGVILADYTNVNFKSKIEDNFILGKVSICAAQINEQMKKGLAKGITLANAQNYVRGISESPPNIMTPEKIAEEAKKLAKSNRLDITIFRKAELEDMGMNAILAVNNGSALPPEFVALEYNKGKKEFPFYAVAGKGVTFDSGGISLKPSKGGPGSIMEMKFDKTGAVCTLGIIKAVSELRLPIRLLAVFAATENMPSGSAQKPGDIIKAYNGKTIEVLNTDAEGRLILADVLAWTAEQKPDYVIDLATLTGAMVIALGNIRIGLFSNDDKLADVIYKAGEKTSEKIWRMPLDKEYSEMIKSELADIKNLGSETGDAGSITAAAFLKEFVGDSKWAHLDIAGVYNRSKSSYLGKWASGTGVRLVVQTFEDLCRKG